MGDVKKSLKDIGSFMKLPGANLFITKTADLFNWANKSSLWPLSFGLACCAIEMMATFSSRYDLDRLGMITRASPRQADLMIVAGTVTVKMGERIKTLYDQMTGPKWVIAAGSCAISGDHYRHVYSVVPGVDWIIPVDVYVPGCPPTPEAFIDGIMELQNIISKGKSNPTFNSVDSVRPDINEVKVKKKEILFKENFISGNSLINKCKEIKFEGYDYINFITATDFEDSLVLTYLFTKNNNNEKIEINVKLDSSNKIDSISQIYPGAEWQEREVFDMFGIEFKNHPKLERILMPDDWVGYPLLKDYKMEQAKLPYRPSREDYESWKTKL
tara:strand:+ start:459 stop:1445 length:987 start_codon:yes stop_codon:yes gene_type:complete